MLHNPNFDVFSIALALFFPRRCYSDAKSSSEDCHLIWKVNRNRIAKPVFSESFVIMGVRVCFISLLPHDPQPKKYNVKKKPHKHCNIDRLHDSIVEVEKAHNSLSEHLTDNPMLLIFFIVVVFCVRNAFGSRPQTFSGCGDINYNHFRFLRYLWAGDDFECFDMPPRLYWTSLFRSSFMEEILTIDDFAPFAKSGDMGDNSPVRNKKQQQINHTINVVTFKCKTQQFVIRMIAVWVNMWVGSQGDEFSGRKMTNNSQFSWIALSFLEISVVTRDSNTGQTELKFINFSILDTQGNSLPVQLSIFAFLSTVTRYHCVLRLSVNLKWIVID